MKTLSIRQPWAWLIVAGHKDIENRTWRTNYRGPVLIHAAARMADDAWVAEGVCEELGIQLPETYELGGIIGAAEITDCVTDSDSAWFEGPYGFTLANPAAIPFRSCRGRLGLFDVPAIDTDPA